MIHTTIKTYIQEICSSLYDYKESITLDVPEDQFGDLSTNIALRLAKLNNENPKDMAEKISVELAERDGIASVNVAGPGFINITIKDDLLWQALLFDDDSRQYANQTVVIEYSDPNPFKELHVGHLYTSVVGDAVANLVQAGGGEVHRVNFGGDVGMHVAKAVWGILQTLEGEHPEKLATVAQEKRSGWLSEQYVKGSKAFEDIDTAKTEITELNKRIYEITNSGDKESPLAQIYWICRTWSYDYFNQFYASIGSGFEKYYPESENAQLGVDTVKSHLGEVYEESDGAIVFKAEKYDLHTRVFINKEGLPTYEAKDVGVALAKWRDYKFDKSIIITANDITEYMKVVVKSIEQFEPEIARRTQHITHGNVKMKGGIKMSSRLGNVIRAVDVINSVREAATKDHKRSKHDTTLAAIKFAFLKQRVGPDVNYDIDESVSLEGKSGPYLQYAHARACSILAKANTTSIKANVNSLEKGERLLARSIVNYHQVLDRAVQELSPHLIALYLYDTAQVFNRFYEQNRVIDNPRSEIRLRLVEEYRNVLQKGLTILNIEAPEKI